MAYNTGNPIGSGDPRDLRDNSENLDEAINGTASTWVDRLGVTRKTFKAAENAAQQVEDNAVFNIAAIEQDAADVESARDAAIAIIDSLDAEAQQALDDAEESWETRFVAGQDDRAQRFDLFLANSGYQFVGDYAAGIELTEYNQVVRDASGNLWRASASTVLPYTTTGTGLPEGGAFIAIGDADLAQNLISDPSTGQGALLVRGSVVYVDTIADLQALPTSELVDGQKVNVSGITYKWNGVWINSSGYVTPEAYGAAGDGETIDTQAVMDALASGLNVFISNTYRVQIGTSGLVSSTGVVISGNGVILGENLNSTTQTPVLVMGDNCTFRDFTIGAYSTNATLTDNTSYTQIDADTDASFDYNANLIGVVVGNDCSLRDLTIKNLYRGISGNGKANIATENCLIYQAGVWCTQYYNCRGVIFTGNRVIYGGSSGGAAFSSSKNITVSNNFVKTMGTGINTGGSSAEGFNVESVTVTGNRVIARDCINLENGCEKFNVTGNTISVIKNYDLTGTNGVGVAATSNSSGSFEGDVFSGVIVGNNISSYDGSNIYSHGVLIGSVATNNSVMKDFVVSENKIDLGSFGIEIRNGEGSVPLKSFIISSNMVTRSSAKGIKLVNVERGTVSKNRLSTNSSTSISNYYGIDLTRYNSVDCFGNSISGYGYPFRLSSNGTDVSKCRIENNTYLPNEQDGSSYIGIIDSDSNDTTVYFSDEISSVDDTGNRFIIKSKITRYTPTSSTIVELNSNNTNYKQGDIFTVEFNGNVEIRHNSPYIILKDGLDTTPPNGAFITFLAYNGIRVKEIFRNY